ncbi:NAD(P)-binding protein, partial [Dichomitus squalens LYAD-421 SS1]|uniref:NAD(P)-binding protein n=1 Tax=Dichomitus squalens (strain LYAD-421) TaxID=732165 RepID=UPI0004413DE6
ASRGIGLALAARLLRDPTNLVVAAGRNPDKATALQALKDDPATKGQLHIVKIDVDDAASIRAAYEPVAQTVGEKGLDVLINNAGILLANDAPFTLDPAVMVPQFVTNVVGPTIVAQTFLPLVEKSRRKLIVNVSSSLGSIGIGFDKRYSSYSITKTALNMLTYKMKVERPDLTVVTLNPGWVKTDLGGSEAPLELDDVIPGIIDVLSKLKNEDSGTFVQYDGARVPW